MPLILPGNVGSATAATGFNVANSCMFDDAGSDYLRTSGFGTPTSSKKMTISFWTKRANLGINTRTISATTSGNSRDGLMFNTSDKILFFLNNAPAGNLVTNKVFRDTSAWYHIVIAIDTTQGTASNRVKIYVNGVQETSFDSGGDGIVYPDQNYDILGFGQNKEQTIGADNSGGGSNEIYAGYMAEFCFIDGTQNAVTDFGEFGEDSGIWKPIDVSGLTFGNNGYYLDFKNSGALGADVSGNTNNFTVNNLTAIDQSTDTCTNNFATMNPLNMPISNQPTFSEGNLKTVTSSSGSGRFGGTSTFGVTQGKWYVEAKATVGSTYSRNSIGVSYNPAEMARNNSDNTLTDTSYAWGWDSSGGDVYHDSSVVVNYATYTTGDICQIFLDLDNHKLYYGKNGTLQSSTGISLDTGQTYFIAQIDRTGGSDTSTFEFNFGSPIYAISSSNTDGEYGNFEYSTTITGDGASKTFKALNSANLAEHG